MRICHLTWSLNTGGAEHVIVDLANAQARRHAAGEHASASPAPVIAAPPDRAAAPPDHQVAIAVVNDDVEPTLLEIVRPEVRLIRIGRPPGSANPFYFARLLRALRDFDPCVVHTHRPNLIRLFSLSRLGPLGLRPGTRFVTTVHTTGVPVSDLPAYDKVFAVSKHVAADLKRRCPSLNPVVVPNGIDFSLIPEPAPRPRRWASDPAVPFRIVQIARLDHEVKGQDILLKAVALLKNEPFPTTPPCPPALCGERLTVDFIGAGPSLDFLRRLARDLGIAPQVNFLGRLPRKKVYELLPTYDLMVHPARREGFGLVIVEALAAGVPVLVPNEGACWDLIGRGKWGHGFESENPESCARSVFEALHEFKEPELATRVRKRGGARPDSESISSATAFVLL